MSHMTIKKMNTFFCIILAIYVCIAGLYSYYVPAWESPDEPAHYLYVKHLSTTWRPPPQNPVKRSGHYWEGGYVTSMYEWYHPALGYAFPAMIWRILNVIKPGITPTEFPAVSLANPDAAGFDRGLFMSSRDKPAQLQDGDLGLILLRFGTALLGVPLLWAVYAAARLLYSNQYPYAILATVALAGFIPQFVFIMGTVRNDSTNNLMSALSILLLLKLVSQPLKKPVYFTLLAGTLVGMTLLTKSTASFLVPAALIAFLLSPYEVKLRGKLALVFSVVVLVIVGAYYVALPETRAAFIYNSTHVKIKPEHLTLSYLVSLIEPFMHMFWGRFGWASVTVPDIWVWSSTILCLLGITTSVLVSTGIFKIQVDRTHQRQIWILLVVILTNLALIIYYNLFLTQPQGRFLFPSLLPFSMLVFWGFTHLQRNGKSSRNAVIRKILFFCVVVYLLAFNYVALFQSIIPAHYIV
jgi:hypothetical protein